MSGRIAAILPLPWDMSGLSELMAEKLLLKDPAEIDGVEPLELLEVLEVLDVVFEELPHPAMTPPTDSATTTPLIHLNLTIAPFLSWFATTPLPGHLPLLTSQSRATKSISINGLSI